MQRRHLAPPQRVKRAVRPGGVWRWRFAPGCRRLRAGGSYRHPVASWEGALMLYSALVKKLVRQSFDHVNHHRWEALLKSVAPNVHHRFGGAHAIGGERHDKAAMHRWLERVGRVLPTPQITVNH